MSRPHLVAAACFLALFGAGSTARSDPSWNRHPRHHEGRRKPATVPADYVFTHNGFFHPSCVIALQPDEVMGRDFSIRGPDGVVRDQVAPCPYTRFDLHGNLVAPGARPHSVHAGGGGNGTYDGWLLSYSYASAPSSGSNLSTKWVVPEPPTQVASQDIAFFNDMESSSAIIQPVLDFSELPGQWAIEAESLVGNNDVQSTLVAVNPGDVLLGTVTSANCSNGVCQSWTITLTDTTTGMSTTQTTEAVTDAINEVDAAVLETYDVDSCARLPASGEVPFLDNQLTTSSGASEPETYTFESLSQNGVNAEVPTNCGWNGMASGNDYTLIFGMNPSVPGEQDAGAPDAGDADAGGSTSSGSSGGSGSSNGSGSSGSSGGVSSSSSGASPTGSSGSSGGAGSGGAGSGGGASAPDSGSEADGFGNTSTSAGCGCRAIGGGQSRVGLGFVLGLGLAWGARRRRRPGR
jgi:hypothetical protein